MVAPQAGLRISNFVKFTRIIVQNLAPCGTTKLLSSKANAHPYQNKDALIYHLRGMNSLSSPTTFGKRPSFQSALACSIRSLRLDTKFQSR